MSVFKTQVLAMGIVELEFDTKPADFNDDVEVCLEQQQEAQSLQKWAKFCE